MSRCVAVIVLSILASPATAARSPIPKHDRFVLKNGLTVVLVEDHAVPVVSVSFRGRAGSLFDAPGKEGTAQLVAAMLTPGTPTRTEKQLRETLERWGATLHASAGMRGFYLGGSVPSLDAGAVDTLIELASDVLLRPTFPEAELEKERKRLLGGLAQLVDDHSSVADRAFEATLLGGHPYGRPTSGTIQSVKQITKDDLLAFHGAYVVPDEAILGIAGDFDRAKMRKLIEKRFGDVTFGRVCPAGGPCRRACQKAKTAAQCEAYVSRAGGELQSPILRLTDPKPKATEVVLVDTGDPTLNQAQLRVGTTVQMRFGQPGWHAHYLATQVLGGDFTARLNARLRVKEGLTYGARFSALYDARTASSQLLSTYTTPKDVARAIKIALEEITRFRNEAVPADEIDRVKKRLVNSFPFRFETPGATLGELLDLWQKGLGTRWLDQWRAELQAVTADALTAAKSDLPDTALSIVVVGNAALVADLQELAKSLNGGFRVIKPAELGIGSGE